MRLEMCAVFMLVSQKKKVYVVRFVAIFKNGWEVKNAVWSFNLKEINKFMTNNQKWTES